MKRKSGGGGGHADSALVCVCRDSGGEAVYTDQWPYARGVAGSIHGL